MVRDGHRMVSVGPAHIMTARTARLGGAILKKNCVFRMRRLPPYLTPPEDACGEAMAAVEWSHVGTQASLSHCR